MGYVSGSAQRIVSLTVMQDDPIVEYEDEFGRVRTARRSDIPRHLIPDKPDEVDSDEYVVLPSFMRGGYD